MIKAQSTEVTGQAAQQILDSLLTPQFVSFLEEVTGIARLIPDPSHAWAGIHVSPPGSFQVLHRDFRLHPQNGLFHRVNVLVYLNSDWKEEYGGKLELWSTGKHALGQQVSPVAGKLVLFETTPFAFHGVPDPVRCPPERARISLASYYYTDYPAPTDRREWIFYSPKRPQDPWYLNFRPPRDSLYSIVHPVLDLLRRGQSDK
jgi:Rps23 Pro-64 3,4-dihydroxylase Tpa1-like proline 4-hydroxylase